LKIDEKILKRFEELIEFGKNILKTNGGTMRAIQRLYSDGKINSQKAIHWETNVENLLSRIMGNNSVHYKNFVRILSKPLTYIPVFNALGVLEAAKDDYKNEHMYNIRQLVEAEVFDDFLEQADHLLKSGYYQPAAVVCGCVLEDGMRKLCERNGIEIGTKPKLDKMNADLAKAGIYTKLTLKKITHLADLRNKAAHGQWEQFKKKDVEEMLSSVRRIMEQQFS